jgi:hypothetical protein
MGNRNNLLVVPLHQEVPPITESSLGPEHEGSDEAIESKAAGTHMELLNSEPTVPILPEEEISKKVRIPLDTLVKGKVSEQAGETVEQDISRAAIFEPPQVAKISFEAKTADLAPILPPKDSSETTMALTKDNDEERIYEIVSHKTDQEDGDTNHIIDSKPTTHQAEILDSDAVPILARDEISEKIQVPFEETPLEGEQIGDAKSSPTDIEGPPSFHQPVVEHQTVAGSLSTPELELKPTEENSNPIRHEDEEKLKQIHDSNGEAQIGFLQSVGNEEITSKARDLVESADGEVDDQKDKKSQVGLVLKVETSPKNEFEILKNYSGDKESLEVPEDMQATAYTCTTIQGPASSPPLLVVEKIGSEPGHEDEFGSEATVGQREAHKLRAQDDLPELTIMRSDSQTPEFANTAAEVADTASTLDREPPPLPISDEEAGRTGYRRMSMTPIPEVALTAAEVADTAALLDKDSEVCFSRATLFD